jgi:ribosomal protein S18 acetylase RimI-like enzyme
VATDGGVRVGGQVALRPVEVGDDEFLFDLYRATRDDIDGAGLDEDGRRALLAMQYAAQKESYRSEYPNADHYIVLFDEKPVGRYMVERRDSELRGIDLAIIPEFRTLGIGTSVIRDAFRECAETNRRFVFHVLKSNRAMRLYLDLGCVVAGETATHYRMEWKP